jgi:hypothetical protein
VIRGSFNLGPLPVNGAPECDETRVSLRSMAVKPGFHVLSQAPQRQSN